MDNAQNMLDSILSDPNAMAKIQELSKQLGFNPTPEGNSSFTDQRSVNQTARDKGKGSASPQLDLSALSSLISNQPHEQSHGILDGISSDMIGAVMKFLPMLKSMNKEDDSTVLLNALRPFLSPSKQTRLDEASKILKIMRLLPMIRSTGLLG